MAVHIKLTSVIVDDQKKALNFYTDILGFVKKMDIPMGPDHRWLTVVSAAAPDGAELVLEPNANPAAQAYQQALFAQKIPLPMLFAEDLNVEHARLAGLGVAFTMLPTAMPWGQMSVLNDTCGNLIALAQV